MNWLNDRVILNVFCARWMGLLALIAFASVPQLAEAGHGTLNTVFEVAFIYAPATLASSANLALGSINASRLTKKKSLLGLALPGIGFGALTAVGASIGIAKHARSSNPETRILAAAGVVVGTGLFNLSWSTAGLVQNRKLARARRAGILELKNNENKPEDDDGQIYLIPRIMLNEGSTSGGLEFAYRF